MSSLDTSRPLQPPWQKLHFELKMRPMNQLKFSVVYFRCSSTGEKHTVVLPRAYIRFTSHARTLPGLRKQTCLGINSRTGPLFPKLTLAGILSSDEACSIRAFGLLEAFLFVCFPNACSKSRHCIFNMATKFSPLRAFSASVCTYRCHTRDQGPAPAGEAEAKTVFSTNDHGH